MAQLNGWNRRKLKIVNGSTVGTQTNYQMQLTVHKATGTDTITDIYLDTNVRDDFGDVRFTKSDGYSLLNYWLESISGTIAKFWIQIDSIPISGTTIYIYYDYPSQITASDGTNTFLLFDDFLGTTLDGTKWSQETGSSTVNSSYVTLSGNADTVTSITTFSPNIDIIFKTRSPVGPDNTKYMIGLMNAYISPQNGSVYIIGCDRSCSWYFWGFQSINNGTTSTIDMGSPSPANNVWEKIEIIRTTSSISYYLNDTLKVTHTNIPSVNLPFKLSTNWGSTGGYGNTQPNNLDYIRIRKYVSPEPTFGSSGSEEILQKFDAISMAGD